MAGRKLGAKRAKAAGRSESGQAVVLSVVWMVVLLGMAGLVIDVGSWYRSQRDLQSQADAARSPEPRICRSIPRPPPGRRRATP